MKLKFKTQAYQTAAVQAVVDCFKGQPPASAAAISYRIDPGKLKTGQMIGSTVDDGSGGFKNADLKLTDIALLENITQVQHQQNLPLSTELVKTKVSRVNLDIEMETGTGKTYCYIKTIFELNKSTAGASSSSWCPASPFAKACQIAGNHGGSFLETYGKRARFFIYNSKQLHNLESFSSDAGINVMVINVQAFNATGKDARRIYEELDDFQSRRPIDVIKPTGQS